MDVDSEPDSDVPPLAWMAYFATGEARDLVDQYPPVDDACCMGVIHHGPKGCTCWQPVYDVDQAEPDPDTFRLLELGCTASPRAGMCADCAYRPGSPEKRGDPGYSADAEQLEHLAAAGIPFWCHDGMRRPVRWRHPSGREIDASAQNYLPPQVVVGRQRVPVRTNGQPGLLCAGWDARRRALADRGHAQDRTSADTP